MNTLESYITEKIKPTEEEYDLSKKITFNLIYGGFDQDIKDNVPFMNEIVNMRQNI